MPGTSPGMAQEPALSLPKGGRPGMAEGSEPQTPCAPETPFGSSQRLNRTAVDLFRVSLSTVAAGRPHGYPEQVRV